MEEIKISAKTLDEAKTQALLKLNTSSDNIVFKVIEEGSSGLLGFIGSKPWVISARIKSDEETDEQMTDKADTKEEAVIQPKAAETEKAVKPAVEHAANDIQKAAGDDKTAETMTQEKQLAEDKEGTEAADPVDAKGCEAAETATKDTSVETREEEKEAIEPVSDEEATELIKKGVDFLQSIFAVMDIKAEIKPEFDHSTNEIYYEFCGDDMGVLIGKRGQTLDSLQYLVSLVVNKHRSGYIRVKLDTENYRDRRRAKLEELAHNIAQKVKRSRRKVELEPMNPYERRIIHSALQGDPYVTTISEGDEPYRHVVILLKRDQNHRRYNGSGRDSRSGGYANRGRGYDRNRSRQSESSYGDEV